MKYTRLTKEQLEEMHGDFINFLASQQIDKGQWDDMKTNSPELVEQQLDLFSDLVWDEVLQKAEFLEHYSKNHIFLFGIDSTGIHSIVIKSLQQDIDFLSKEGLQWLSDAVFTDEVEVKYGSKPLSDKKKEEIFEIIQQGAILSDGALYKQFKELLKL
ncbi:DUF6495 family protein [Myroides sp. LJL119]